MKFLILLVIFSTFLSSQEIRVQGLENKKPERVLYIGNSYFYYNDSLHNHVRRMLEEYYSKNIKTGKTVRINMEKLVAEVEKLSGKTFIENE